MAKLVASCWLLVAGLMLSSCITYQKCLDKFGKVSKDSVAVRYIDSVRFQVEIPADTLQGGLSLDSLCIAWQQQTKNFYEDTLTKVSASGKLQIKYWIDRYQRALRYQSTLKPDTVYQFKIVKGVVRCPPQVVVSPDNDRTLWKQFQLFAAWVVIAGLAFALVYLWFNRK